MSTFPAARNHCPYENCGKVYRTFSELITHKEREHLDFNPHRIKQLEDERVEIIPMSYVLRHSNPEDPDPMPLAAEKCEPLIPTGCNKRESAAISENTIMSEIYSVFAGGGNPPGTNNKYMQACDFSKERKPDFPYFNDLRANGKLPPEILMHLNSKIFTFDNNHKKPFGCNMPGCNKRYKNANGVKYHCKNVHNIFNSHGFKKSLLKYKTPSRPKQPKPDLQAPLLTLQAACGQAPPPPLPQGGDILYRNLPRFDDCDAMPPEFVYKFGSLYQNPVPSEFGAPNPGPIHNLGLGYCYNNLAAEYNEDLGVFSEHHPGANSASAFISHFGKS